MGAAERVTDPQAIIARCTRNGVVSWQHVAAQLGCSVDHARNRYDPTYLRVRPWPHRCEFVPKPEDLVDENDTRSLAPKGPGMALEILRALERNGALSVEKIAGLLGRPRNSVRMRLSRMYGRGWVTNDSAGRKNGVNEWSWSLTPSGLRIVVTGCAGSIRERA